MDWKRYQTVNPLQKEPQVGRGLFGIRLLIFHFKFQFSKSIKSSTFHIFLNLTYPLRTNISFPKHPKITQKFTQNRQIVVNEISIGIQRCLKCDRDIGRKAVLSDMKTAFTCTPAIKKDPHLNRLLKRQSLTIYFHSNYCPDNHTIQTTDSPGFKPLTLKQRFFKLFFFQVTAC